MLTTETNIRMNTTDSHISDNKLSVFSYHKVQAMISELEPKTSQQNISGRFVSIFSRIKTRLTPSESTKEKIKLAAIVIGTMFIVIATNALAIGVIIGIGLSLSLVVSQPISVSILLSVPILLSSITSSFVVAVTFFTWGTPELQEQRNTAHILKKLLRCATILEPRNVSNNPDIDGIFQLTNEIQDLSFMSGSKRYDKVHSAFVRHLKKHQQCHDTLLQYAAEQDKNKLQGMLEELYDPKHLSLSQMDEYHALLEESTQTPEESPNTESFKAALAQKLLSEISPLNEEILNTSDKKCRLTGLKEDVLTQTIDLPNETETEEKKTLKTDDSINSFIDRLHYTSRLCSLLNSCYPFSTIQLSQDQCNQLTQCDIIYKDLRTQLLDLCLRPDDQIPKIWAMSAITRQINRTWIARHKNQPPYMYGNSRHTINPVAPDNPCYLSHKIFDEIAPTVAQADNIILFDADNHLYDKESLLNWQKRQIIQLEILSPENHATSHILDFLPLPIIINMKQFTIKNLLPAALPLDFIPQQAGAS